jgi:hypothetical protein
MRHSSVAGDERTQEAESTGEMTLCARAGKR